MLFEERMDACRIEPMHEVVILIYIGIDVHKKFCYACIKDKRGVLLEEFRFLNTDQGFTRLLRAIGARPTKAVIESTGNLWLRLFLTLEESGVEVILSNPSKTKAIAEARLKSDKVDAAMLADLLRADLVAPCYVPPVNVRDVRELTRVRMNLVRDRVRVKNRTHALLERCDCPRYPGSTLWGKAGVRWLNGLELPEAERFILQTYLNQLKALTGLVEDVERVIAQKAVEDERIRLLMTIPGIDYYVAMLFVSEIGDIDRFPSSSKLVSWLGLAPRVSQSGEKCYHGAITKMGSPRVRWALVQVAHSAVRYDDHFQKKFRRISERRGKSKAYVAVARELAVACFHMLKKREPYRFADEGLVKRKYKRLEKLATSPLCAG
ncbi:MAG: IS110 family transposase [Candidatus Thorarchaeota archaeon]